VVLSTLWYPMALATPTAAVRNGWKETRRSGTGLDDRI
jgi:hypothetical protein